MSGLERACQCGAFYLATSPYDYSCPDCWQAECHGAVRIIEWVGGMCPPGAMAVERTPLTDTLDAAIAHVCGPWSRDRYLPDSQIVPCLVTRYRKPHTAAIPLEYLDGEDVVVSHDQPGLYVEDPDEPGRAFALSGDGWWWMDTEVAFVGDPCELNCDEKECCLAKRDA